MTVEELKIRLKQNSNIALIDVREEYEVNICKIASSLNLPMSIFTAHFSNLPKDKELIVYCHHGIRSQAAVNFLKQQGYSQVKNLEGGINQWAIKIDQTMRRY